MRNEEKARPVRKALRDVSNSHGGGGRSSIFSTTAKKKDKETERPRAEHKEENQNDVALDRLLLVQSDLSSLINQIDQLVVEAFKCKAGASKEVESFAHFLSEMHSSLKPWVPRFQKALSGTEEAVIMSGNESGEIRSPEVERKEVESLEESDLESLISPSPLVSWRADCTIQRGRQLFMLTPLPISKSLSSKPPMHSKPLVFERVTSSTSDRLPFFHTTRGDTNADLCGRAVEPISSKPSDSVVTESGVESTPLSKIGGSMVMNLMTPCLKSPPKSCVLLEPISDSSPKGHHLVCNRKSTPYPAGIRYAVDSSSSDTSDDADASPDWCMSPPKSCVLLEPCDVKPSDEEGHIQDTQLIGPLSKESEGVGGTQQYRTAHNSVASLGLPQCTDQSFANIVSSLRAPSQNQGRGGGALSSTCNAIGEIFKIAAIMNGLTLVGVAVGFVLLRIEAFVEESAE